MDRWGVKCTLSFGETILKRKIPNLKKSKFYHYLKHKCMAKGARCGANQGPRGRVCATSY